MKKIFHKTMLLSVLLLATIGAKGKKSKAGDDRGGRSRGGLVVLPQTVSSPIQNNVGMQQASGIINQNQISSQGIIQAQQPMAKAVIGKLFDEEKHLEEKLRRAKEYSALEYVALECVHIIETLDRASNKIGLEQMGLMNISNPNTVLGKYIAVKYSDISNAGGFGYYVTPKNNNVGQSNLIASQNMMMPNAMFMTQERSAEIVRVQDFVKKWSNLSTYVNTRPDDQNFITEFKFSYVIMKNLVKKYLGQDLRSMIMANPNRVYNETSVLIDILNNQLLPKLLNDPNYKIPYKNLQPEIKNLGYNARYVFVMTCDGVYTDGNGMNPNQSNIKAWAQTGTN